MGRSIGAGAGEAAVAAKEQVWLRGGSFSVWSVEHLRRVCDVEETAPASSPVTIHLNYRRGAHVPVEAVDVHVLQSEMPTGTMFQVASNFNCLEAANEFVDYQSGTFVTQLMTDKTQGPAASSACALAAIVRAHVAPSDGGDDHRQRLGGKQIELLGDDGLRPYFPVVNGKLYTSAADVSPLCQGPLPAGLSSDLVRAGLMCDAVPMFRRVEKVEVQVSPFSTHRVDQVFVAALDLRARGLRRLSREAILDRMHFLLQGAYDSTYGACSLRKSKVLVLTLVGGGVFGNPWLSIGRAIGKAHVRWARLCPELKEVHIPIYTVPTKRDLDAFIKSIEAEGARVRGQVFV